MAQPVLRYGEKRCAQASICARFNTNGSQIIALRRRLPPVLYDTHSSKPVCQFDAEHYYNSCTMKSCCFAGDNDQFVLSGSDDFNLYMWKIPDKNSSKNFVSEAHMVLKGHRSIVNEVRFNPQNFIIASSGVEKIVKLWSGLSLPGSKGNLKANSSGSFMTRRVYTHDEYIGLVMESGQVLGDVNHDYSHGSVDEDPRMMAFFDSLVQREVEGWTSNTDLSDDLDNDAQGSGHDDDDTTTTTQSSLSHATSQSDDNDSDDGHESSDGQQAAAQKLSRLQRQQTKNDDEDEDEDEDDDDEREKVSGGSEWIMHLIAKKRAKLKIAKRAKRKRKHLRRHRKKSQRVLRSFPTQIRYLYQPGQNPTEEHLQAELPGAVAESGGAFRRRTSYRRRYMAPYTIMVVHNSEQESEPESDEQENENVTDTEEDNHTTEQQTSERNDKVDNGKRLLWSSDSESSLDNVLSATKRKRTSLSDSDSDEDDQEGRRNGQVISEIIDSGTSDSETEKPHVPQKNLSSEGSSSRSCCLPNILNDATLSEESFGDNNGIGDITSELNISSTVSDAIPISSISYDDNGSLLFETEHSSLVSGLDLPSTLVMPTAATASKKNMQNGSCQSINGTLLRNTTTPNVEKGEDGPNEQDTEDNGPHDRQNANKSEQSMKFKKRMSAFNVRNYRRHSEDDL
ncbi:DDB1- and CUL4-associated factor 5 [Chionoecetes opilio]|uniref:DDB1- and CUL4-associated factor 5 n=1 Tax=Chionoecetes opilio TaxID=41210 RepID=A0A8J4YDU7_CHIOP|nr:DDB1- and CUL4-associated factor 5 [Chionoecetes opilio]